MLTPISSIPIPRFTVDQSSSHNLTDSNTKLQSYFMDYDIGVIVVHGNLKIALQLCLTGAIKAYHLNEMKIKGRFTSINSTHSS